MPIVKNAFERYLEIDRCLRNTMKPYPSINFLIEKLSEKFGKVSKSTVDKDINYMKEQRNAPIKYSRDRGGYYYADPNYSFQNPFTQKDLYVFDFATAAVNVYGYSEIQENFKGINNLVNTGGTFENTDEYAPFNCIQIAGANLKVGYKWIFDLYIYIQERQAITIDYHPYDREPEVRVISPYLLKESKGRWYIIGYDHNAESKLTKVFALDRIQEIGRSRDRFFNDPLFNKLEYFKYSLGVYHNWNAKPEKVLILLDKKMASYFLSMPIHNTQTVISNDQNGLQIEIEVYVEGNFELINLILGYGHSMKVLSPIGLKQKIQDEIKKIAANYEK